MIALEERRLQETGMTPITDVQMQPETVQMQPAQATFQYNDDGNVYATNIVVDNADDWIAREEQPLVAAEPSRPLATGNDGITSETGIRLIPSLLLYALGLYCSRGGRFFLRSGYRKNIDAQTFFGKTETGWLQDAPQ